MLLLFPDDCQRQNLESKSFHWFGSSAVKLLKQSKVLPEQTGRHFCNVMVPYDLTCCLAFFFLKTNLLQAKHPGTRVCQCSKPALWATTSRFYKSWPFSSLVYSTNSAQRVIYSVLKKQLGIKESRTHTVFLNCY